MNGATNLEHRASSSQDRHEGEPSLGLCDRLDRTRDNSQRQLPTDHDYAVPTREYQTDQSSLITAPAAARSVFGKQQKQRQKQTHPSRRLTRSLHIRPTRSLRIIGGPKGRLVPKNALLFINRSLPLSRISRYRAVQVVVLYSYSVAFYLLPFSLRRARQDLGES
jgi:hypothetical protein